MGNWNDADEDYEMHGTWTQFDQTEFVGIDSDRDWGDFWNWMDGQWK